MTNLLLKIFARRALPYWFFGIAATAILIGTLFREAGSGGAFVLWLWSILLAAAVAYKTPTEIKSRRMAWMFIAAAIAAALLIPYIGSLWACFFGLCSVIAYTGGTLVTGKMLLPCFILTVLVPSQTYLYDLLSFPLSRLCTVLTVGILRILGITATFENAIIFLGKDSIAVTAACSGIELLEAMLLIGWIIVYRNKTTLLFQMAHFLTLLPTIVICNSLRLVIVILLYLRIGTQAFEDPLHSIMGFATVIATVLLMQLSAPLFRPETRNEEI